MPVDVSKPHRFHITRRKFLGSLAATAAAVIYPFYCEPRWLEVTRNTVLLRSKAMLERIRVLHLSDLHASLTVPLEMIDQAISVGLAQKPDVICLTGDFVTDGRHFDPGGYVKVLRRLSAAAPTYAVVGNHDARGVHGAHHKGPADHRVVDGILAESGITLLHNRSTPVEVRRAQFTLVGVGDLWTREVDAARAFAGVDTSRPVVLLAHNPDTKELLPAYPWDLMLCGHTHGGQVRVPFAGPVFAPVKDKRYVAGLKPWEGRQIYVTRGVGNLEGVRFRCRPEVSVLELA